MGINDPDWGKVLVTTGHKIAPVGDPNRWGAVVNTQIPAAADLTVSDQFLRVQAVDRYARSWSINGQLTLPFATYAAVGVFPAGPFTLLTTLEIVQGVGQAMVTQEIVLMCDNLAIGLCNTQNVINGGPYLSTYPDGKKPLEHGRYESRPFAAIGALIGNSLAIRVKYYGGANNVGLPATGTLSAIVTPYAAGEGV